MVSVGERQSTGFKPLEAYGVVGNRLIPRRLDYLLARSGWDAQMIGASAEPDRPNNLQEPVDDKIDYGDHGSFDDKARERSYLLWAMTHPTGVGALIATLSGFLGVVLSRCLGADDSSSDSGSTHC
jgi:hypothetical protein